MAWSAWTMEVPAASPGLQLIARAATEKHIRQFLANGVPTAMDTAPKITVRDPSGEIMEDAEETSLEDKEAPAIDAANPGLYGYLIKPKSDAALGYYSVWWEIKAGGATFTLDVPSTFEVVKAETLKSPTLVPVEIVRHQHLFGVELTTQLGAPMPDSTIQRFIRVAERMAERISQVTLYPTVAKCNPAATLVEGVDYDIEEDAYPFDRSDFEMWGFLQLRHWPVISVERFAFCYGGQEIINFTDAEWVKINKAKGQIEIVPAQAGKSTAFFSLAGMGGSTMLPFLGRFNRLPHLIEVDYTHGFEAGKLDEEFGDAIGKLAAALILHPHGAAILDRFRHASSVSIGADGLSQSLSFSQESGGPHAPLIKSYMTQAIDQLYSLRDRHSGIIMEVL